MPPFLLVQNSEMKLLFSISIKSLSKQNIRNFNILKILLKIFHISLIGILFKEHTAKKDCIIKKAECSFVCVLVAQMDRATVSLPAGRQAKP